MPQKLPYYNYNLNSFFKNLYHINQSWFAARGKLTQEQGFELEDMVNKVKSEMQSIEFKISDIIKGQREAKNVKKTG